MRHALILNEDRKNFIPECMYPEFGLKVLWESSFLQTWFLGAHIDTGGSVSKDGLALYPLQWMLLESKSKGLVLEFGGNFDNCIQIHNPLHVVFPVHKLHRK